RRIVHALIGRLVAAVGSAGVGVGAVARRAAAGAVRAHVADRAELPIVAAGSLQWRRIVHALVACLVATIDRARARIRAVARRAGAGAVAACVADRTEQAVAACRPIHRRRVVHALVVGLIAAVCGAIVPIRAAALSADTAAGDADVANGTEQAVVAAGA